MCACIYVCICVCILSTYVRMYVCMYAYIWFCMSCSTLQPAVLVVYCYWRVIPCVSSPSLWDPAVRSQESHPRASKAASSAIMMSLGTHHPHHKCQPRQDHGNSKALIQIQLIHLWEWERFPSYTCEIRFFE